MFLEPFKRTNFLRFESQSKKTKLFSPSLLTGQAQSTLIIVHFWVFVNDYTQLGTRSKVHCLLQYFYQRWSPRGRPWPRGRPRGHIFKSLALASKPLVLENCPVPRPEDNFVF